MPSTTITVWDSKSRGWLLPFPNLSKMLKYILIVAPCPLVPLIGKEIDFPHICLEINLVIQFNNALWKSNAWWLLLLMFCLIQMCKNPPIAKSASQTSARQILLTYLMQMNNHHT
jgi:hypothetical protein